MRKPSFRFAVVALGLSAMLAMAAGPLVEYAAAQLRQALQVQRRGHQEHPARMQERGGDDRDIAAEARADQHQVAGELLAEIHQPRNTRAGLIDAAVIDRVRLVALGARHLRERRDLAPPRPALLAVREDDVAGGHERPPGGAQRIGSPGNMRE